MMLSTKLEIRITKLELRITKLELRKFKIDNQPSTINYSLIHQ